MQINLNGTFDLNADLTKTFAFLTDPKKLSMCIQELKETKFIDDRNFETVLTIRIGPIPGNFSAKCNIDPTPPDTIKLTIEGSGTGSSMHLALSLKLTKKTEKITSVAWSASTEIGGIVSGLGETVLRELSSSKIEEIISAVRTKVPQ